MDSLLTEVICFFFFVPVAILTTVGNINCKS